MSVSSSLKQNKIRLTTRSNSMQHMQNYMPNYLSNISFFEDPMSSALKFNRTHLRPMQGKDQKQVLNLLRELALYEGKKFAEIPIHEISFMDHAFIKKYFQIIVADYQNKIVAVALYFFTPSQLDATKKVLFLNDLYVTPNYRGHGIGTTLLKEMQIVAKKEGCSRVEWELDKTDEKAQAFYHKMGAVIENCSNSYLLVKEQFDKFSQAVPNINVSQIESTEHVFYFVAENKKDIVGSILAYDFYSTSKGYAVMYIGDIFVQNGNNTEHNNEIVKSLLIAVAKKTKQNGYGRIQMRSSFGAYFNKVLFDIGGEFYSDYSIAKLPVLSSL